MRAYFLFFALFLDILLVISSKIVLGHMDELIVGTGILFCVLILWRLSRLKIVTLDISEHIVSVKITHPFSRGISFPQLEVPLYKIFSCHLKGDLLTTFLMVNIHTKNNVRSFYYDLGFLSKKSTDDFKKALEILKTYNEEMGGEG